MRKAVFAALALFVTAAGVFVGWSWQHPEQAKQLTQSQADKDREAISAVFQNLATIREKLATAGNVRARNQIAALIPRIDVSQCPTDFKLAWSDYLYKLERSKGDALAAVVSLNVSGLKNAQNETADALHNCVQIGIKYGAISPGK